MCQYTTGRRSSRTASTKRVKGPLQRRISPILRHRLGGRLPISVPFEFLRLPSVVAQLTITAIAQLCAACSPFSGSITEIQIFRQLQSDHVCGRDDWTLQSPIAEGTD